MLAGIDPNYLQLLWRGINHEIRLEQVVWGGVKALTGIPSLDFPKHIAAVKASFMTDKELVFGIAINGDVRAYPLRFMNWHEMFSDKLGGKYVTLAYYTLCASGILFNLTVKGRKEPFKFGSSGLLCRSNKLLYDHENKSLWNQFTGRPVVGKLTRNGIELKGPARCNGLWGREEETTSEHESFVDGHGLRSSVSTGCGVRRVLHESEFDVSCRDRR